MNLGEKFRKIRTLKGYSEEYLVMQMGMSQANYSKYELNKISPTMEFIQNFTKVCEIDFMSFINMDDNYTFNNYDQKGGNAASLIISASEERDKLLEAKDETIKTLANENLFLKEMLTNLGRASTKL